MKIKTQVPSFEIEDNDGSLLFLVEDDMINIYHARTSNSAFIDFKRTLTFGELVKAIFQSIHFED